MADLSDDDVERIADSLFEKFNHAGLSDDDVERISCKLFDKFDSKLSSFWIEPQKHYDSHRRIDDLLEVWKQTKSTFLKTFIGIFILGVIAFSAFPLVLKKVGG